MPLVTGPERRQCPPEFQERITRRFGTNPFSEPLFKLVWSKSEFIRMGNEWMDRNGYVMRGYRDRFKCPTNCWMIMRWRPAREYGSPGTYYRETRDPVTGLQVCGEYPWRGRYEVLQPLYSKEMRGGKLVIEQWTLSNVLIDRILPLLVAAKKVSIEERKAAQVAAIQRKHKEEVDMIAELMANDLPTYYGPVSYGHQGCRTSFLDRKMDAIKKQWDRLSVRGRRPTFSRAKGFFKGNRPNPN